jgi:hypothetical protein
LGKILDETKTQFVLEVGFPELLVIVDIVFEFRVEQFLDIVGGTPEELVVKEWG